MVKLQTAALDRFFLTAGILILLFALILAGISLAGRRIQKAAGLDARTLVFTQWWQDELEPEALESLVQDFERRNPEIRIKLDSRPYMEIRDRLAYPRSADAGRWDGSAPKGDILGLDPQWLYELVQAKRLESLTSYRKRDPADGGALEALLDADPGAPYAEWAAPVVSFMIPLFYNIDIFRAAGFDRPPKSWTEFKHYAKTSADPEQNRAGFALSLSAQDPYGVYRDIFSWFWASGASMTYKGRLRFDNQRVIECLTLLGELHQQKLLVSDPFQKTGRDRLKEFTAGSIAMMLGSVSDIRLIRDSDISFGITTIPNPAGYFGKPRFGMINWYAGINRSSRHKKDAWAFLQFLAERSALIASQAAAVPGNPGAAANYIKDDPLYSKAYDIYEAGEIQEELVGFPRVGMLEAILREELRPMLEGRQSPEETARAVQRRWEAEE
ncbi:MAG: extracellular solute-binding protein [Treponema sp.]|jgi:multiple sugar transport system substrate-binding protein|nr:extracellular solute-binding protein [Treponema sp.]